jgi:hypothetical protein
MASLLKWGQWMLYENLAGMWEPDALVVGKSELMSANPLAMGSDHEVLRVVGDIGLPNDITAPLCIIGSMVRPER